MSIYLIIETGIEQGEIILRGYCPGGVVGGDGILQGELSRGDCPRPSFFVF